MIDAAAIAKAQLGVREKTGKNDGVPFERYALPGEDPLAWCARAVRWVFTQWGHRLPGNPWEIASCTNMQAALEAAGAWLGKVKPQRNDILFVMLNGRLHVGIVEESTATHVVSLEGNYGDKYARVVRGLDDLDILGVARWPLPPSA